MFWNKKHRARRVEIRRNRPETPRVWQTLKAPHVLASLAIAFGFWAVAVGITTMRESTVRHRLGDYVHEDVLSRVDFQYTNADRVTEIRERARNAAPRVYQNLPSSFDRLEKRLLALPEEVAAGAPREIKLDLATTSTLKTWSAEAPEEYKRWVRSFIDLLKEKRDAMKLVILPHDQLADELRYTEREHVKLKGFGPSAEFTLVRLNRVFTPTLTPADRGELLKLVMPLADQAFQLSPAAAAIAGFAVDSLEPTHKIDYDLTIAEQKEAARTASLDQATQFFREKSLIVPAGTVIEAGAWKLLNEEQKQFVNALPWQQRLLAIGGLGGVIALLTGAIAWYVVNYQPRIAQNHMRGGALAGLLLSMHLLAQVAALSSAPLLIFGVAPSLLVAVILAIAYERRFAIGVASLHGLLVTLALGQGAGFFMIIWVGVLTCGLMLDEVRTRSKLIEVGGASALTMMAAAAAVGAANMDPSGIIGRNCLQVGAAGLGVGFFVLGILDAIERAFRITTSLRLLEVADASHPLLRRLAVEAPGTYSHSLQVATLAEAAAEAIGANSLLCRVGSYYHDIGKMNKADYFCENQSDGHNRHLNLTPTVSLLVIVGHVKDGVELAKEYSLPPALLHIIQQHHGTTLVEYFYHKANTQQAQLGDQPPLNDSQFRYPGPKPRTKEAAIVMCADMVESATRAMGEPTPSRIESLVHDLIMKRLLDGQFDESPLTFAELHQVERALMKTLLAIYHGRVAYPSNAHVPARAAAPAAASTAVRSA